MDWITTSTILADLRSQPRNDAAWGRLVQRFRVPIIAFAHRLGLPSDVAEEVAQETLLAFTRALDDGKYSRERGRLNRWLFGIAYRQILHCRGQSARRPAGVGADTYRNSLGDSFLAGLPDEGTAAATWDVEWEQAVLSNCLERVRLEVDPATFLAFEASVMRGADRSADEVARELGTTVKAVYNAKHRILKRIRELRAELEDA